MADYTFIANGSHTFTVAPRASYVLTAVGKLSSGSTGTITPTMSHSTDTADDGSPAGMPIEATPGNPIQFKITNGYNGQGSIFFYTPDVDEVIVTVADATGPNIKVSVVGALTSPE